MKSIYTLCFVLMMSLNALKAQNVGIGTFTPTDQLHVNSPSGTNPLLIQINSVNKLRVNSNGGTSIGTPVVAPADGLYIAGVTNPVGGIRSSTNPISIQSNNDSVEIIAGQNKIVVSANGGIRIIAANGTNGITIDAGAGDLNLNGRNVNITATNNTDITTGLNFTFTTGNSSVFTTGANLLITAGTNTNITTGGTTDISSFGKMKVYTNNDMSFVAGINYTVNSGADLTIEASAINHINGALVILNNGNKGAARTGDITQTSLFSGVGSIINGSPTVLIGN